MQTEFTTTHRSTRDQFEEEAAVIITIPQPPSVNALYVGKSNGGKRLSKEGRVFYSVVKRGCMQLGIHAMKMTGTLRIEAMCYPKNSMFDTANFIKATLDALEKGGVVKNDRSFRSVDFTHVAVDAGRPRIECRIFRKRKESS